MKNEGRRRGFGQLMTDDTGSRLVGRFALLGVTRGHRRDLRVGRVTCETVLARGVPAHSCVFRPHAYGLRLPPDN